MKDKVEWDFARSGGGAFSCLIVRGEGKEECFLFKFEGSFVIRYNTRCANNKSF